ncbi:uncharacterized protein LOC108665197 [Hyalella azteca]|uniref:Uncharacterized protein LOC108665197 n=1 Tax=Hyalella azteca TaxID=294128 RepID=A0A8B7N2I3_HYAAZ|nr:uncharacterized protein LOC108665197 [Hyalella azteca]
MLLKLPLPGLMVMVVVMMLVEDGEMVWHFRYDFLMTVNYAIPDPYYSELVQSRSECRRKCVSEVACAAYSYEPLVQKSSLWRCTYSNMTEVQRNLDNKPNVITYFKERKPKEYLLTNLSYPRPDVTTFWQACGKMAALPGLILSYQDWLAVKLLWPLPGIKYIWIPLVREDGGVRRWLNYSHFLDDDGPLPQVTYGEKLSGTVMTWSQQIQGVDENSELKILCFKYNASSNSSD